MQRHLLCRACNPYSLRRDVEDLRKHLLLVHGDLLSYTCGQCYRNVQHKTSFVRHIQQQHDGGNDEGQCSAATSPAHSSIYSGGMDEGSGSGNVTRRESVEEDQTICTRELVTSEVAQFLLRLRTSGNLTNATVSLIQEGVQEILETVIQDIGKKTKDFLSSCEVPCEKSSSFLTGSTFHISNVFENFQTVEDQLEYFCDKFGLVKPDGKMLANDRVENRFDRSLRMVLPKQVISTFQSISLVETLTLVVRNPYLRNLIESEEASTDGKYRTYKDGTDFKNNPFLRRNPYAIRIILYYDDLEVANALGSKDVIHKLGCFYISVQNLPPEESSQLTFIFLLALAYAEDLKSPGAFQKVLTPFLPDLERLKSEEGVAIQLPDGSNFTLRACLVCLSADALAAHSLLGILSPSCNFFCRLCLKTLKDMRISSSGFGAPRTSQLLRNHVAQVKENPTLSRQLGVKEESPLRSVMRVPEDSVFDVFHDLVGVIQMTIKLALYEYVCVHKYFSVFDFNSRVNMFVYGEPDVKNKPSPNFMFRKLCDSGHTLKQNGSQTFCLLRVFPFLVSGVLEGDEILDWVFLLQDIVKIMCSLEVSDADLVRLDTLQGQFTEQFDKMFVPNSENFEVESDENQAAEEDANASGDEGEGDEDDDVEEMDGQDEEEGDEAVEEDDEEEGDEVVEEDDEEEEEGVEEDDEAGEDEENSNEASRPSRRRRNKRVRKRLKKGINKLHHMLHCSKQTREKGPCIRLWCARFEGRHRIFRKHSAVQSNFKNVPKTMANMFQLSTLGPLLARKSPRLPHVSDATTMLVKNCSYSDELIQAGFLEDEQIQVADSVEIYGEVYSCGLFVSIKDETSSLPAFGIIENVVVQDSSQVFVAISKCQNNGLSGRYNSYRMSNAFDARATLTSIKDLANYRTLAPWIPCDKDDSSDFYLYPRTLV